MSNRSTLWAISAYFNPCGYRRRRRNFEIFRERLGVPLVVVELSRSGRFELRSDDAEVMVRVQGSDVLWQKERLLNLAIPHVPDTCQHVAWLDADVLFADPDWPMRTADKLEQNRVIQLFGTAFDLTPEFTQANLALEGERTGASFVQAVEQHGTEAALSTDSARLDGRTFGGRRGFAWAAQADVLRKHGLYDACVIGGGDDVLIGAAYGQFHFAAECLRMNPTWEAHYRAWAAAFYADVRGNVGYLNQPIYHLWHGTVANRKYRERFERFRPFEFDPQHDVVLNEDGVWRWGSAKAEMHQYVRDYFAGRQEDGDLPQRISA